MRSTKVSLSLLAVLNDLSTQQHTVLNLVDILKQPQPPIRSLPFIPPPRWAAELSRRLKTQFPEVEIAHQSRQLQAFIHPSFTTSEAASSTMRAWSPAGEAVIHHIVCKWILSTFDSIKTEEASSLITVLTSDSALSHVVRDHWQLENMILTDASADLFSRDKLRSSQGLARWLASNSSQIVPEPFMAECLKAQVGVVLAEKGLEEASKFCVLHLLPYLG